MSTFVLYMTRIPVYVSDYELARVWKEYNGSIVKTVKFEPSELVGYRKATVWFTILVNKLPFPYNCDGQTILSSIKKYKKNFLPGAEKFGNIIGFLEPCSTTEESSEFSFMIALQLQDIVRQQAKTIECLESRLNEIEKRVNEGIEIYIDIHKSNMDIFTPFHISNADP